MHTQASSATVHMTMVETVVQVMVAVAEAWVELEGEAVAKAMEVLLTCLTIQNLSLLLAELEAEEEAEAVEAHLLTWLNLLLLLAGAEVNEVAEVEAAGAAGDVESEYMLPPRDVNCNISNERYEHRLVVPKMYHR